MPSLARLLAVSLCLLAASCGGEQADEGGGTRLKVVASFYPVAEAAGRIGGERAEVVNLTPAGTEPHDLELTPRQVDQLEDADLVLYLGRGFQPAVEEVAERRGGAGLDVLEGLPLEKGAGQNGLDPHFWLDPVLMQQAVDRIQSGLSNISPANRAEFERNAAAYRSELQALHGEYERALSSCRRRELVTSHAAFHYLSDRYRLTQEPIAGLSPEAEPNPERLSQLIDLVRRRNVTTVFYETLVSPRVAQTLARNTGTKAAVLNPIEGLTDEEVRRGATYASVMRENLTVLKDALGCG